MTYQTFLNNKEMCLTFSKLTTVVINCTILKEIHPLIIRSCIKILNGILHTGTLQILHNTENVLPIRYCFSGNTPKYGLIFHSSFIGRAGAKNKGRISRYLANKCTIASRYVYQHWKRRVIYSRKTRIICITWSLFHCCKVLTDHY